MFEQNIKKVALPQFDIARVVQRMRESGVAEQVLEGVRSKAERTSKGVIGIFREVFRLEADRRVTSE